MNESPVHGELRVYVDEKFKNQDQSFRDVLFSLAYSEYCLEKKRRIARRANGSAASVADVKSVVLDLQNKDEYKKFCANAELEIRVLGQRFSEAALGAISGVVIDKLDPKFDQISHLVKSTNHKGFWSFIKSSGLHALEIVVAVVILKIVYQVMVFLAPIVGDTAQKYLGPFFAFWGP